MSMTYDVRIWGIKVRKNANGKVTSYGVRWKVGAKPPFFESFKAKAAADSFRADLLSAQRRGEAFDTESGLPMSMARSTNAA